MKTTKNNKRFKPLYKNFKQVFENVQSRQKIFKFKKKKWSNFQKFLEKKSIKLPLLFNHSGRVIERKSRKAIRRYSLCRIEAKKLNMFYGGLKKKYVKKVIRAKICKKKSTTNKSVGRIPLLFVDFLERRLETALYRSFFTQSIKNARQLILHGHVFVNQHVITNGSYILKRNDIVDIDLKFHKYINKHIELNLQETKCWATQINNNITVNYKTLQILYTERSHLDDFSSIFPFDLNIKHVIRYYKYY